MEREANLTFNLGMRPAAQLTFAPFFLMNRAAHLALNLGMRYAAHVTLNLGNRGLTPSKGSVGPRRPNE